MKTRQHNGDMIPICCEMLGLDPDTPLQMYEEVRQSMVEPLDPMRTLAKSELQTGDIVVFQFPVKDPYMYQLATAKEYFSYLTNRIDVTIHKLEDPKGEGITIELLKNAKYETIVNQIGRHPSIGVEGQYVRLTAHSTYGDGGPRDKPVKTADAKTLKEMLPQAPILYYEILSVPIQEIESKKELEVAVVGRNNALITSLKLLMDKKATIGDLKKVILEKVEREEPIGQLRILDVYNHKIHKVFEDGYHVGNITTENTDVVAEEIVDEDATLKRIQVQHFCKEQQSTRVFGFPFHIYVSPTETVKEVKEKIQQRLGVKDEDFKRYKFTILAGVVRNTYLNDDDILAEIAEKESSYKTESVLGMEHKDPTPRTSTNRWYDKPIVIKN
jgi:ubiquitin carboxyl-terminal hydrolase 7